MAIDYEAKYAQQEEIINDLNRELQGLNQRNDKHRLQLDKIVNENTKALQRHQADEIRRQYARKLEVAYEEVKRLTDQRDN